MRDVLYLLIVVWLVSEWQASIDMRDCRTGWQDISEYDVLSDVCDDSAARSALLNGGKN